MLGCGESQKEVIRPGFSGSHGLYVPRKLIFDQSKIEEKSLKLEGEIDLGLEG